jgi:hypothetical protein
MATAVPQTTPMDTVDGKTSVAVINSVAVPSSPAKGAPLLNADVIVNKPKKRTPYFIFADAKRVEARATAVAEVTAVDGVVDNSNTGKKSHKARSSSTCCLRNGVLGQTGF